MNTHTKDNFPIIHTYDIWLADLPQQATAVDKSRLIRCLGHVDNPFEVLSLRHGLAVQLGLLI